MTKNSKNHDESPDKHYTFFKTSESSGTKKQNPRQKPSENKEFLSTSLKYFLERFRPLDKNVNKKLTQARCVQKQQLKTSDF